MKKDYNTPLVEQFITHYEQPVCASNVDVTAEQFVVDDEIVWIF